MNSSEIKKQVKKFRSEYGLRVITMQALEEVFEKQGFTIVDFNPVSNDPDTATVIENLGFSEMILHSNAFLYADSKYRLIFINEKLNEEERKIVLAHEEGHYICGHAFTKNVIGHDVIEEREANEFSHYLLRESVLSRFKIRAARHKKLLIVGAAAASISIGGSVASKEYHDRKIYEGEYYVTLHGEKYHKKDCITIEGHEIRRLTKADFYSGDYEPCEVCHPER